MDGEDTTISMPISVFQEEFLPMDAACKNAFSSAFPNDKIKKISQRLREGFKPLQNAAPNEKKKGLLQTWAKIDANEKLGPLCPGHVFNVFERHYERGDSSQYNIEGSFNSNVDKFKVQPQDPNWALQRMGVNFNADGSGLDPYAHSPEHEVETGTKPREGVEDQVMSHAANVFSYQQRTAFFMLLVNGPRFQMMRWDRSGAIVTEAADYLRNLKQTRVLLRLLFAFSHLSESGQGRDPTAVLLKPESCGWKRMDELAAPHPDDLEAEENEFPLDDPRIHRFLNPDNESSLAHLVQHSVIHSDPTQPCDCEMGRHQPPNQIKPTWKPIRDLFRETLSPQWPRFQITVYGRKFLVGKQSFKASGMVGRGTRGFPALDWDSQEITFLKDTWRPFYAGMKSEGKILADLNKKGVHYVPTVVCYEDISSQETVTSAYSPDTGSKKVPRQVNNTGREQGRGLRHMIHHRMVVKEVCLQSTMFSNAKELFLVIFHCVIAHRDAHELCHLIHRDISAGNILIYPKLVQGRLKWHIIKEGRLNDWELAKLESQIALQPDRVGTWQYMSHSCLTNPGVPVGISDELESFVHVAVHHAVRFLSSNLEGPEGVRGFVLHYFDSYVVANGLQVTPASKSASVLAGHPTHNGLHIEFGYNSHGVLVSHPINKLFAALFGPIQARYLANKQKNSFPAVLDEETNHTPTDDLDISVYRRGYVKNVVAPPTPTTSRALAPQSQEKLQEVANKINTHQWFLDSIDSAIFQGRDWPKKDRIADQLVQYAAYDPQSLPMLNDSDVSNTTVMFASRRASRKRSREGSLTKLSASASVPKSKRTKTAPGKRKLSRNLK